MREYPFVQVDVFTDRIFGGNQLAVFLEPSGLTDAQMQDIAREMNFAETTFVFPPTSPDAAARVRIFTPGQELPFAGHPTIGTAWVLARHGRLPAGVDHTVLEENIGPVSVTLQGDLSSPSSVWMSHRDAEFGPEIAGRAAVLAGLGLTLDDALGGAPIRSASTGVPFLFVPLKNPETVDRAVADMRALSQAYPGERVGVFIFAPDPARGPMTVYSRMFAGDTIGFPEDAATGAASGPLGAFIVAEGILPATSGGVVEITSEQGYKMRRPSTIHIRLEANGRSSSRIQIGGSVVPVLEGVLRLP